MNAIHKRRIYVVSLVALLLSIGIGLILYALKQNINVFLTPTEVAQKKIPLHYQFRLGGMVKKGSLVHEKNGLGLRFVITDFKNDVVVHYVGVLPDLFREGKGAIAEGRVSQKGFFIAAQILAKHDENYTPMKSLK